MQPTVVLLGPPGSGKGTQAARLREGSGFAALATGDLLRETRAAGSELGRRAADYMDRGELVPDHLILAMMRDAIARAHDRPILLDGFPRTVAQADALARVLDEHGRALDAAVLLDVPDDVVAERISGRHEGREDDRPETVRERLRVYHRDTEPLIAYYDERALLRRVDGAGDPDAVEARLRAALGRDVDPGARVCPFCGEPPGPGTFCAVCGRNLAGVQQLPTRRTWERGRAATPEPAGSPTPANAADAVAAFVAAMHRAGDPGAAKMPRAEPGFLGRTQHVRGWVVRAVGRGEDDPPGRYEPGLFVTVEGRLHRLDSATRGLGQRTGVVYLEMVGPEVVEPAHDDRLAGELAAVLRANGLDDASS